MIACLHILANLWQTYPLTKMKRQKTNYKYFQHLFSKVNMEVNKMTCGDSFWIEQTTKR